jgi:hypothetical protein
LDDLVFWITVAIFVIAAGVGAYQSNQIRLNDGIDPAIFQDTGKRFLQPFTPPIMPPSITQQISQAGLRAAAQVIEEKIYDFAQTEAYHTLVEIGTSPVAAAVDVHQQTQANLVGIGQLATGFYHSAPGLNITNAALRRGADVLSQLPSRPLGVATGAGLAGTGELGDEAAGVLSRSPVNALKGLGTPLSIGLTVNEVHQTFQDPNLTLEQQNQRAGIQVGALVGKLGTGALIRTGVGLAAGALGIATGGPLAFGIIAVGSGLAATGIDAAKTQLLRYLKLQQ